MYLICFLLLLLPALLALCIPRPRSHHLNEYSLLHTSFTAHRCFLINPLTTFLEDVAAGAGLVSDCGWAAADNAISAGVQGVLWSVCWWNWGGG
jgi:hypothetical protein